MLSLVEEALLHLITLLSSFPKPNLNIDQELIQESESSGSGYKVTTKSTTYRVSNGNKFTDHSESIEVASSPSKTVVHSQRVEVTHSFGFVQGEMHKLRQTQDFYSRLRDRSQNFKNQNQEISLKLDGGIQGVQTQVRNLEAQTDALSLDLRDVGEQSSKKATTLEDLKTKFSEEEEEYKTKESQVDEKFNTESQAKDLQIVEYLEKLGKAQKEMELLVENSVKDREAVRSKIEDLQRQVLYAKDLKFFPEQLNNSQKERDQLKLRLGGLADNYAQLKEQLEQTEQGNDKLQRELSGLSSHTEINKPIQEERDLLVTKTKELATEQNKLYNDNVQKLKRLHQVELEITERRAIFPMLKNKLNASILFLSQNLDTLGEEIGNIDSGTKNLDSQIGGLKGKVQNPIFQNALDRIQNRLKDLGKDNGANGETKDGIDKDLTEHRINLAEIDFYKLQKGDIDGYIQNLKKVKDDQRASNKVKDGHAKDLNKLRDELADLEKDILAEYEKNIKVIHKRSEGNVNDTTSNLDKATSLIDEIGDSIDPENPATNKFLREYEKARQQLADVKGNNGNNQRSMEELANRNMTDGDNQLDFLITLSDDQLVTDGGIQDNKKNSESLLDLL